MRDLRLTQLKATLPQKCSCHSYIQEIDPSMLNDPMIDGKQEEQYVGHGSFGVVKVQVFHDILVAVKECLPKSLKVDVVHEASILNKVCHPYLPLLIGICTSQEPLRIVMQFHAFNKLESKTMNMELQNNSLSCVIWLSLCAQLLEALAYLHEEVNILHNDIKLNNVLIAQSGNDNLQYQAVLIDFGIATLANKSKRYNLSGMERIEYVRRFPHIAPEVVEGETCQTIYSDVYAYGKILFHLVNHGIFDTYAKRTILVTFAEECVSPTYFSRPRAGKAMDIFKQLLMSL